MPVIRIASKGCRRQYKRLFAGRHQTHLDAELILLVCLAFGDALHLWGVHAVNLGRLALSTYPLLAVNALGNL